MRAHRPARPVLVLVATLLAGGPAACVRMAEEGDLAEIGLRDATSEPPPGLLRPVAPDDLVSVHDRGRLLHQLEKALRMGYADGMLTVGDPGTDAVLPLVDVDPGGRSAQALFVRWRPSRDGQLPPLSAATAERWLLVSMLLTPDRVVDVEILQGPVAAGSHLATRIDTVLAAAERVRTLAPGAMVHLLDLYEEVPVDPERPAKGTTAHGHVYALSADGDGPDLELVVAAPRRRSPPSVLQAAVVHASADADPLRIETSTPGPVTVARAMLRGLEAGSITVQSPQGDWIVAAGTGLVRRADGTGSAPP
jgi:hypothetical protein